MEEDYLSNIDHIGALEIRELVEKYWRDIWNYAFYLTKKYDAADDIAQETFVKAFLNLSGFRGQSSVKTWLIKICHRQTANYRRSAFVRKVIPVPFVKSLAASYSAEAVYFRKLRVDSIFEKLFSLSHKYREVLLLEIRYGLSIQDMADILHIPEGTVKSRLYRARSKMRTIHEEWEEEGWNSHLEIGRDN